MSRNLVFVGRMTLRAGIVTRKPQLGTMWIVTIAAGDAGREHLALLERAVVVDLVEHLTVGVIEPAAERRNHVCFGQRSSRNPGLGELAAAGVAEAAGLCLSTQCT